MKPWTCHTSTSFFSTNSPSLIIRSMPNHPHSFFPQRHRFLKFNHIACSTPDSGGNTNVSDGNNGVPDSVQSSTRPPPGAVEVRFRRRSRRQARQQRDDGAASNSARATKAKVSERSPKKWEEMSLTEKAIELYAGEKGLLFWLNKFAYASIFIMIGAWILFRFVGPSLNLYQLDSPPLPLLPSSKDLRLPDLSRVVTSEYCFLGRRNWFAFLLGAPQDYVNFHNISRSAMIRIT